MFSEAFDEEILGMKKGQTKEFTLEIPEDETAVLLAGQAGKPVTFEVTCNVVKKKVTPEVTDEWAKEKMGFESVEDMRERIIASTPLGRLATAEDIAGAVAMLAGDDAAFITGQTLHVDGGLVMR